jgi:hypothetical protein
MILYLGILSYYGILLYILLANQICKKMMQNILVYIIVGLMMSTAVIYLVAASQELTPESSSEDDRLSSEVQMVFFVICGVAYIPVGIWIVADRTQSANRTTTTSTIPYIIAIAGSAALIALYVVSRIISLPLVGLQTDVGTIDVLAKILEAGIIAASVYVLLSVKKSITKERSIPKLSE